MKADKFTKVVLAIIAMNLTILTFKNYQLIPGVIANEPTNNVKYMPNMNYGLVPLNEDGSITVKLSNYDKIDVRITDITTYDKLNVTIKDINTTDKLNVHLKSSDPYSLDYAGPIEVEMN
jgi:hypothetical protein